jgi:REP element-mobilizing transposase RayT
MPSIRVNKIENNNFYFLTFTIKNWHYILDRYNRWDILANSIKYFQQEKELKVYSYVFMINHIHLLIHSPNTLGFIRDFKKYTSFEIFKNIKSNEPSILKLFLDKENNKFKLWKNTNMPKLVTEKSFLNQKTSYIINNPVKRNYVEKPEDWHWSSANLNSEIEVTNLGF